MRVREVEINNDYQEQSIEFANIAGEKIGCKVGPNLYPVVFSINSLSGKSKINFVQCGVYKGGILLATALLLNDYNVPHTIIGFDSFGGFPQSTLDSPYDHPSYFEVLYNEKRISEKHYKKAKERTGNFTSTSHLSQSYFDDCDKKNLMKILQSFPNVSLVEGAFEESLPKHDLPIDILHLDCDLYASYETCLNSLYDKVIDGGIIIFDEYYSLKYPGAKKSVDDFFSDKPGEMILVPHGDFERWLYIKS